VVIMHRTAAITLSLLASAGLLYATASPAAACSCAYITDPAAVRSQLEDWDGLVVEGQLAPPRSDSAENMRFLAEVIYWGDAPAEIVLEQTWAPPFHENSGSYENIGADCSYFLTGEAGDRYVLYLLPSERDPAAFATAACGSIPLAYVEEGDPAMANPHAFMYDALVEATGGGTALGAVPPDAAEDEPDHTDAVSVIEDRIEITEGGEESEPKQPESEEHDKDTPWAVVLPLSFAIPLAVLFLPALLRRRTPGH
jgi:hypothetical protein